jgi:hypothetical protein
VLLPEYLKLGFAFLLDVFDTEIDECWGSSDFCNVQDLACKKGY